MVTKVIPGGAGVGGGGGGMVETMTTIRHIGPIKQAGVDGS